MAVFPDVLSRILSIVLGISILMYSMHVKVQETEVQAPVAKIEP